VYIIGISTLYTMLIPDHTHTMSKSRYRHRMHQQPGSFQYNRVDCKHPPNHICSIMSDQKELLHKTKQSAALQDAPATFWPVVTSSVTCSAITFVLIYGYWRFWPNRRHRRRVKDMAAIRDLLVHHMDDLDDIMDRLHLHSGNPKRTEGFRV